MLPVRESEVFTQAFRLYNSGQIEPAYDLLTQAKQIQPEERSKWFYWRTCLSSCAGNTSLALEILQSALDNGYFYPQDTLMRDDDLMPLHGLSTFDGLVKRSQQMNAEAQAKSKPELTLLEPMEINTAALPMVMALHGNNSNVERTQGYWHKLTGQGYLVALPQSSQVGGKDVYVWNDTERARQEIQSHYAAIRNKYALDAEHQVIAGFSKGGYMATRAALEQFIPVKGLIAVAPFYPDLQEIVGYLGKVENQKLRAYFLLGEIDPCCTPAAQQLSQIMKSHGVESKVEVFHDVAHAFPHDYQSAISRALQFIFSGY